MTAPDDLARTDALSSGDTHVCPTPSGLTRYHSLEGWRCPECGRAYLWLPLDDIGPYRWVHADVSEAPDPDEAAVNEQFADDLARTDDVIDAAMRAVNDPGQFCERERHLAHPDHYEALSNWQRRALAMALASVVSRRDADLRTRIEALLPTAYEESGGILIRPADLRDALVGDTREDAP